MKFNNLHDKAVHIPNNMESEASLTSTNTNRNLKAKRPTMQMKEDDIDSYYKFMDNYEKQFHKIPEFAIYVQNFNSKFQTTQIRSNFLQSRVNQQTLDLKAVELTLIKYQK